MLIFDEDTIVFSLKGVFEKQAYLDSIMHMMYGTAEGVCAEMHGSSNK